MSDGYVFVMLSRRERGLLGTQSWWGWTVEQKARAASDFVTYCGLFEVRDGLVIHHIEMSLLPEWVGDERIAVRDGAR